MIIFRLFFSSSGSQGAGCVDLGFIPPRPRMGVRWPKLKCGVCLRLGLSPWFFSHCLLQGLRKRM